MLRVDKILLRQHKHGKCLVNARFYGACYTSDGSFDAVLHVWLNYMSGHSYGSVNPVSLLCTLCWAVNIAPG